MTDDEKIELLQDIRNYIQWEEFNNHGRSYSMLPFDEWLKTHSESAYKMIEQVRKWETELIYGE